jgi:hypothetical protein
MEKIPEILSEFGGHRLVYVLDIYQQGRTGIKHNWSIGLVQNKNTNLYEIWDNAKFSLFRNPLAFSDTEGGALMNFMNRKEELLAQL